MGSSDIENLLKIGVSDAFDNADEEQQKKILEHDERIIREML